MMFAFLCVLYVVFLFVFGRTSSKGVVPVIKAPSSVLEVSVKAKQADLLAGISASDKEDGNLTESIFIEKISKFDENKERTITYVVFDSDDNISRATRKIKYTDYKEPVITLKNALMYIFDSHFSVNTFLKDIIAVSSVDGNISSKISVTNAAYVNNYISNITVSVTDSCGVKTSLDLNLLLLTKIPNIDIELKTYLKRVKVGTTLTEIAPRDTIESISVMGIKDMSLKPVVELTHDYNPNVPGTYEFIYRISSDNGDYGMTKLVVIVEE